ncbi:alkaline phosphatase D family protein [Roseateles sp. BYS180W]|uniref:Alkaline phosphatase D family protein n=1 Tax=Roseateles rivi TaxID=3299028 RepID=A0ABW7FR61_9BURK
MTQQPPLLPQLESAPLARRQLLGAVLAAGVAPGWLRQARAQGVERFAQGVASGFPRPDGMVLWTKLCGTELPEAVPVQWEIAKDEQFSQVLQQGEVQALARDAHCLRVEPRGLAPDRWYWYRFSALGQRSAVGRTRSAPAPDAAVRQLRFAIASCQHWEAGRYAAWADMQAQNPDLVMFLGDYIYEYRRGAKAAAGRQHPNHECLTLQDYRERYALYKSDPQLQAMHAAAPWVLTWDDHEVANDYAGDVGQDLAPNFAALRHAAVQAYWEHLPFPEAWRPREGAMQLYRSLDWGQLARVITLDDRQFRAPHACPQPGRGGANTVTLEQCPALADPQRSLLGTAQEAWLARQWDRQRWNLLAQQTLMAGLTWQDREAHGGLYWTEGWNGYMATRDRLLQGLHAARARNTVVLGGDVHANYVAQLHLDALNVSGPVLASEFCGTSISSHGMAQSRIDAARPFNPQLLHARSDERGYVLFELSPKLLQAQLRSVLEPERADSAVAVQARFVVEDGRPGPQAA